MSDCTENYEYSDWRGVRICVACKKHLYREDIYKNKGVCPYCGNSRGQISDITAYKTVVVKAVYKIKYETVFWFFKRKIRVFSRYEYKNPGDKIL